MNTQSIESIATLLGVAVALNVSALAGPGPQSQFQTRSAASQKSVPVTPGKSQATPTIAFGGTKSSSSRSEASGFTALPYVYTASGRVSAPTLTTVTGPRGTTYLYRW